MCDLVPGEESGGNKAVKQIPSTSPRAFNRTVNKGPLGKCFMFTASLGTEEADLIQNIYYSLVSSPFLYFSIFDFMFENYHSFTPTLGLEDQWICGATG